MGSTWCLDKSLKAWTWSEPSRRSGLAVEGLRSLLLSLTVDSFVKRKKMGCFCLNLGDVLC
ncbi:hypothetical protein PTKIN_Ptkin14bG0116200 [Pterospermum kingtungense]